MLSFECIKNEKSVYFLLTSAIGVNLEKIYELWSNFWPFARFCPLLKTRI